MKCDSRPGETIASEHFQTSWMPGETGDNFASSLASHLATLTPRDEASVHELLLRLHDFQSLIPVGARDALRDSLVMLHKPLVEHCARALATTGEPFEDLVQVGYIGLIKAVDKFNPAKGVRFATYAHHLIMGEIRHYLRDFSKLIHEPGWHAELRQRVSRAQEQLTHKLARPPLPEEIAQGAATKRRYSP